PIYYSERLGAWAFSRYQDVQALLKDGRLGTERAELFAERLPPPARASMREFVRSFSLLMLIRDPPDHTPLRALINKAFTPGMVQNLRPQISAIVDGLLDAAAGQGALDLIADLAYPLPAIVIAEMLGLGRADIDRLKRWSDDLAAFLGTTRQVA